MFDGSLSAVKEPKIVFDGPPWGNPKRMPEEIEEFIEWNKRFDEESRRLDAIEPIPDNFIEICKGKAWPPVYSK